MTTEVKEEIELLMDSVQDKANTLDDYLTEEVDELANTDPHDREAIVNASFNISTLRKAVLQLNSTKATLQHLIDKNQ
ncbi:hypothetical protein [Spirosoma endophyticum]|uniref:Uncharacterized protein n=1 Tax=Spirosoma endophyticum TaxID=662367 RepID=A0A1I1SX57_9BACT|nr:hypothetical protein [Spirosoma endophyticum]SFD47600.1 hypothetical protein SAMN05216167_105160 [Spirosoma endophyticum]